MRWIDKILGKKRSPKWEYLGNSQERLHVPKWVQKFADNADLGGWPREFELKGKTSMYQVYAQYNELTGIKEWQVSRRRRTPADKEKPRTTVFL